MPSCLCFVFLSSTEIIPKIHPGTNTLVMVRAYSFGNRNRQEIQAGSKCGTRNCSEIFQTMTTPDLESQPASFAQLLYCIALYFGWGIDGEIVFRVVRFWTWVLT